tara:strand:+ start:12 stop:143 length:132 start_codon:yes stop_codon:yes gene_type:complete
MIEILYNLGNLNCIIINSVINWDCYLMVYTPLTDGGIMLGNFG